MSTYRYEDYVIFIHETSGYSCSNAENRHCDKTIIVEKSDLNKCFEIQVTHSGNTNAVLLVASYYTPTDTFAEVHKDGLFLMLNDILCIFNPGSLAIDRKVEIDPVGTMFEVHRFMEDYILYGEMEIYRVSSDLKIEWEFSARDIFVRCQGDEPAFEMKSDRICLIDFLDNYYEIDYSGNILVDKPFHS